MQIQLPVIKCGTIFRFCSDEDRFSSRFIFFVFRLAGELFRNPFGGGLNGVSQGNAAGKHQAKSSGTSTFQSYVLSLPYD